MNIDKTKVMKVYSGKVGCMCGCKGIYRVASAHVDAANKDRGYAHELSEVNDRTVTQIVNKLTANPETKAEQFGDTTCYHVRIGNRQYAAYTVTAVA